MASGSYGASLVPYPSAIAGPTAGNSSSAAAPAGAEADEGLIDANTFFAHQSHTPATPFASMNPPAYPVPIPSGSSAALADHPDAKPTRGQQPKSVPSRSLERRIAVFAERAPYGG